MSRRAYWIEKDVMWVVGAIDSHGDILARPVSWDIWKDSSLHSAEEKAKGKRWRWSPSDQEFPMTQVYDWTPEEELLVLDWLEKHGYAEIGAYDECASRYRKQGLIE